MIEDGTAAPCVRTGIARSEVAAAALACAAVTDALVWGGLVVALSIGHRGPARLLVSVALPLIALVFVTFTAVRPALAAAVARAGDRSPPWLLPVPATGLCGYSAATEAIGLHGVVGAVLFGLAVPRDSVAVDRTNAAIRALTVPVLLPLYFGSVGMRIEVSQVSSVRSWVVAAALLAALTISKTTGAAVGGCLAGLSPRPAACLGVLLNSRGVTELLLVTIGFDAHIISSAGLTILVLLSLSATALTAPLARRLMSPLDSPSAAAGTGAGRRHAPGLVVHGSAAGPFSR